jgi:hypothetical protein
MRRIHDLSLSGIQFKMRQNIVNKLEKAGAIMKDKAVNIEEAELDLKEQTWFDYFAGAFLGKIEKTEDQR